jgi:hypothetical protein
VLGRVEVKSTDDEVLNIPNDHVPIPVQCTSIVYYT